MWILSLYSSCFHSSLSFAFTSFFILGNWLLSPLQLCCLCVTVLFFLFFWFSVCFCVFFFSVCECSFFFIPSVILFFHTPNTRFTFFFLHCCSKCLVESWQIKRKKCLMCSSSHVIDSLQMILQYVWYNYWNIIVSRLHEKRQVDVNTWVDLPCLTTKWQYLHSSSCN